MMQSKIICQIQHPKVLKSPCLVNLAGYFLESHTKRRWPQYPQESLMQCKITEKTEVNNRKFV